MITVQRNNKLIAVYKDKDLVATGDKFTSQRELDYCIEVHGGKDCEVKESQGTFTTYANIPDKLPTGKGNKAAE